MSFLFKRIFALNILFEGNGDESSKTQLTRHS